MNALFVVHTDTYFTGLFPVARFLMHHGGHTPVFWFANKFPTIDHCISTCQREGIEYYALLPGAYQPSPQNTETSTGRLTFLERCRELLKKLPAPYGQRLRNIGSFMFAAADNTILTQIIRHSKQLSRVRNILKKKRIRLLVLPSDNRYDLAVFVNAAHQERIPAVIIPQFMAGAAEWAEFVQFDRAHDMNRCSNRVAGALYPAWVHEHKGKKLVAMPSSYIFASELLGIAPPLPWVLHSGHADAIAVESEAMKRYCIHEGLPPERLFVTGSITHDILAAHLRSADQERRDLYDHYQLPVDKPLVLTALPPNQLYGTGRKVCDFQDYDDLVEFWIKSISSLHDCNIVVSLHPSVSYDSFKYIEKWGVTIAREGVASLIPLCHFYIASVSATIQWAIACGKPVVNYDIYRYRYSDYRGIDGVLTMEEQKDFRSALHRLSTDYNYYQQTSLRQKEYAQDWGHLDGQAGSRIRVLMDQLLENYRITP